MFLEDELHEFDNYFQYAPTDDGQRDRASDKRILWHLAGAFFAENWKKSTPFKEANFRWIFDQLAWYFHSVFGSRGRGAMWVVAIVLLFALEVTFVAVVPTGLSSLLSPSNPSRRNTTIPHEAIFMSPLID